MNAVLRTPVFLIVANLIPLIGVLFYEWDANLVLALYWIENLVIGVFCIVKMLIIIVSKSQWSQLGLAVFFVIHYGLFWSGHGLFLWDLLDLGQAQQFALFGSDPAGLLSIVGEAADVFLSFVTIYQPIIWLGLSGVVLSHFVQTIEHFVLGGGVFKQSVNQLMTEPYGHVIVLHAGLLGGAFLLKEFGSPLWLLALIIVFKSAMDWRTQRKQSYLATQ